MAVEESEKEIGFAAPSDAGDDFHESVAFAGYQLVQIEVSLNYHRGINFWQFCHFFAAKISLKLKS